MRRFADSKYRKIVTLAIVPPALSALIYLVSIREFRAHDWYYSLSIYISVSIAVLMMFFVLTIRWQKKSPAPGWDALSKRNKLTGIMISFVFLFFIYWMNTGFLFPYLATQITGKEEFISLEVEKSSGYSRYSCRHQLKSKELQRFLFNICLSGENFYSIKNDNFVAELKVKNSSFGMILEGIVRNHTLPHHRKTAQH